MKKLVLWAILLISTAQIFAQESKAVKFESFFDTGGKNKALLMEKTELFVEQLLRMPDGTKGFIYIFSSIDNHRCWKDDRITESDFSNEIFKFIKQIDKNSPNFTIDLEFGYRENAEIEFWIASNETKKPPAAGIIADCFCPEFRIEKTFKNNKNLILNLEYSVTLPGEKVAFIWTISEGRIIQGQGSSNIVIDISKIKAAEINVTVKLDGLPKKMIESCEDFESVIIKIPRRNFN